MESLNIEETKVDSNPNFGKLPADHQEKRVLLYSFAASLGFLSTGYLLSILNSTGIFLWLGCSFEIDFYSFKNRNEGFFSFMIFIMAALIALNKIKFRFDLKLLILADILMIIGTLFTFTIFSETAGSILLGRIITGLAVGINVTVILSFVREMQYYLSEASFKPEKRRFFIELFFALGIFLGFAPSHILSKVQENSEYTPSDWEEIDYGRPDLFTCWVLCLIPLLASIARTGILVYLGDINPPQYAPAYTDEGLTDIYEEEEDENQRLYMIKFKETRSLMKLLREPYKRRLELCYILHFLYVMAGFVIFTINPLYFTMFLKKLYPEDEISADVQLTMLELASVYLITTVLTSLLLTKGKVPRRTLLGLGCILATIFAFAISILAITGHLTHIRTLVFFYWFSVNIGLGPTLDLFLEEVLPAKGIQFLTAVKWLLICAASVITSYSLRFDGSYVSLCFFLFVVCGMASFVVYDLMPETVDVDPTEIHKLFEFEGEEEDTNATSSISAHLTV